MKQTIIWERGGYTQIGNILSARNIKKWMLVCGNSFSRLEMASYFDEIDIPCVVFRDFEPNPQYVDIEKGVLLFQEEQCEALVAVGGGSAMDVAKCIKLFSVFPVGTDCLSQSYGDNDLLLIAVPTTAGSGSESTRFTVFYTGGDKQSIAHASILPDYAILEPSVLRTLPLYQKKCTMLDALCQGIESWWSVQSTGESKALARRAVEGVVQNWRAYLFENTDEAMANIMRASNDAGQAIHVTQTTAAHAMAYKLTTLYGAPHGFAVALCLPEIWRYMLAHPSECIDPRGEAYVAQIFSDISKALGVSSAAEAIRLFDDMMGELKLSVPDKSGDVDIPALAAAVNLPRLGNNPARLSEDALKYMYGNIIPKMFSGVAYEA